MDGARQLKAKAEAEAKARQQVQRPQVPRGGVSG